MLAELRAALEEISLDRFRSSDLRATQAYASRLFSGHQLRTVDGRDEVSADIIAFRGRAMSLAMISHGADVHLDVGRLTSCFHVNIAMTGALVSDIGNQQIRTIPGTAVIYDAHLPIRSTWQANTVQFAVRIDRTTLETKLADTLGRGLDIPLSFKPTMDTASAVGASWTRSLIEALKVYRSSPTQVMPHLQRDIEAALMAQLLFVHPHNYSDILRDGPAPVPHMTVRQAIHHVRDHLSERLSVTDIAAATGVSTRSLQAAFKEETGETVSDFVLRERLARVHEDLLASAGTVTEIALAWGFTHLSRFSATYHRRYGQLPSTTLRTRTDHGQ